ncbi:MAG: DUF4430 domain-containing protein [Clostridiales bacterium]|nr:DUF4430 domain-containing protein [Clostridiales bacterium]
MKRRTLLASILLLAACLLLFGVYHMFSPDTNNELKHVTVSVVADSYVNSHSADTRAETLYALLEELQLVEGEQSAYGFFITAVEGIAADEGLQQWWCITRDGGQPVNTGAESTPLRDGDVFELTLTQGW